MSATKVSGTSKPKNSGVARSNLGVPRLWRRFVAAVAALAVALPTMSSIVGVNQPAAADDLTHTVPSDESYSPTIHTALEYLGDPYNDYGPDYTPHSVNGVLQSQSLTSATSFAAALPLGTIFIDQSKIGRTTATSIKKLATDPQILAGLTVNSSMQMGYNGQATGGIRLEPNKINRLDGDLFEVTFADAAILPDGTLADFVITYSNAKIVVDQRYTAAPPDEQYLHGTVYLAQGNTFQRHNTDKTDFSQQSYKAKAVSAVNAIATQYGSTFTTGDNDMRAVKYPETGVVLDATYRVVNKDGTPAAGTFVFGVCGINLDRDPGAMGSNNAAKPLWYSYDSNFGGEDGEDGREYSFFSEAMSVRGGQVSDNIYVRPNTELHDNLSVNPPDPRGQYFWPYVDIDTHGNIKFISNSYTPPGTNHQGHDDSYSAGFVTLGNAAQGGFKVTATGHGGGNGGENNMNSSVFNSKQIWYRYISSSGAHGTIQTTSEGNYTGKLDDGGAIYGPNDYFEEGTAHQGQDTRIVTEGKTVTYTMTPDIGYKLKKLIVGDVEVKFDDDAVSKMKKGDTLTVHTADYSFWEDPDTEEPADPTKGQGILTYEEDGTYTFKFNHATADERIHVEWEPTTADVLVAKIWDDENDKDGLRAAAYSDPATTPKVKLQWFVGGAWEDVPASALPTWESHTSDVTPQDVPDGKNAANKYLDGRYEINRDTTNDHPFTWEYLPVYSYDNNGVADRLINYRIVEVPDPAITDYENATYFDGQSFTLDSSMGKSRDGFQLYTDGTATYIKKGDGKYYEVNADGNTSGNPAATQPDPSTLTPVSSNSYYTTDKGTPYQTVDVKNEHKPYEIYIEFTKKWNDAAVQNMLASDGNAYARKNLRFTLHGTIGTNGSSSVVDLNGEASGTDIVVDISKDEEDSKAEATGNITADGYTIYTDGSSQYAKVEDDDTYPDGYYPVSGDTIDYDNPASLADPDSLTAVPGDRTYKIDEYNFGALIENLPTHSEGKPISYTLTETDSATGQALDGWIVTGGQLSPIYNSSNELEGYTTEFVNTPVIDDETNSLPLTIHKRDKLTQGSLEGAVFTVYTNAVSKTKASESATEEIGGSTVYTDGTTKYVLRDDGGEDKYFAVGTNGTVAATAADPQPDPSTLTESKTASTETVDGQTVYTDGTTKYVLRSGEYYTYEDNGDGTYTYTKAANQIASTMRESKVKGAVDENEVVTDANGQVTINFNEPGTYYVVETKAPTGYEADPTIYTFEVDKNLKSVTFEGADSEHDTSWWDVIYELLFGDDTNTEDNWAQSSDDRSGTLTVENDPIRANILINKVWNDNNDQDGLRSGTNDLPKVKLEKTTDPTDDTSWEAVDSQAVPAADKDIPDHNAPITVDQDNYYTWGDLPAYENGKLLYYRVVEFDGTLPNGTPFLPSGDHPEEIGYAWTALTATGNEEEFNIATITDPDNPTSRNRTVTVTNTHVPQKVKITVNKDWADDEGVDDQRVAANLTLYKTVNGAKTVVETRDGSVPIADGYVYTWADLPAFENGSPITYTVEESAVPHYATTYTKVYTDTESNAINAAGDTVDASDIERTWDNTTREETTEATINIRNANLRELTVYKTWINGANSNVSYKIYRTTSTDSAVIDWDQAKVGTPGINDPNQTLYGWTPDSDWEEVSNTASFAASLFSTSSTGDRRSVTIEGLPKADAQGRPYTYRVWEDPDTERYEANQVSNTEVVNTNIHAEDGVANVNVVKELQGRDWVKNDDFVDRFYFKIEPYADDGTYQNTGGYGLDAHGNKIIDPAQVPMPKSGQTVQDIADVDKDDTQVGAIGRNVSFTPIEYTVTQVDMGQTAEYYYKVYEVYDAQGTSLDEATNHTGKKDGITYAGEVEEGLLSDTFKPTEHTLKVVVSSDSTGKITTALFWDGKATQSAVPVYTNTYDASAQIHAHVIKEMQGRDITGDDAFNFTITNMAGAPMRSTEDGTATITPQSHNAGSITANTGSQVQAGTDGYDPVNGDGGSYRAMRSDSSNWIKVSDLSQRTSDGKATDTFIYRVVENAGDAASNPSVANDNDLDFDACHIYLKVVATDNLDGTITIEKSYWYDETCNTNQVDAQVLTAKTDSALAPAGSQAGNEYGYEPAAIFTNSQTIDIPVVKEWVDAPAVEDVTLRLQRKLIPQTGEFVLNYVTAENASGPNNEGWKDVGNVTLAPRSDFVNADGTPKYDNGSDTTASKTYVNVEGFNKDLPKYVTEGGTTYRAVYKLVEDNTSDAYTTTYRSTKDGTDTEGNQIFIDGETLIVTNTVTASNEANIAAVKQLIGRQWLNTDDFEFTLEPAGKGTYNASGAFASVDSSVEAKAAVPMPKDDTGRQSETTGTGADTVASTHAGKTMTTVDPNGGLERLARFGAIEFDINDLTWVNNHYEGDFFYTMKEKVPDDATDNGDGTYTKDGITYDTDSHTVHVKVQGNRTDKLYVQIAYDETTVGNTSTGTQFTPVYTNRYDAVGTQNAQIDKRIMGRDFTEGETFTFKITPLGDTPMVDATTGERLDNREGTLTVSGTDTPQSLILPDIKFILDDLPWTVGAGSTPDNRDSATGTITYSDGSAVVPGMKYGRFMYAFTETSASADDLTLDTDTEYVQVTVIDKGDGTLDTQVAYFEDRYGTTPRYTPNSDGTPSSTPATAAAFENQLKRDLSVTKAWNAPATSDVTLKLQWSTDGTTWNDADGTQWLAGFDSTKTIAQDATGAALTVTWTGLPAYAPDNDDIDLNDTWVRYRVVENEIAHVTTRYSSEAYANGDEADNAKYSTNPVATEAEDAATRVTHTYVTNFVDDLEGRASVNVVKQLIGRGWTNSDSFGFIITPVESKLGGENEATSADNRAMPMPMANNAIDNTATATTSSTAVTLGEYNATFKDIVIKLSDLALDPTDNIAKGEFTYTIKEVIPDGAEEITGSDGKTYYVKNNIKYTADEHTVKIVATNDGTGNIDTTVSYDNRPAGDFVPVYTNEAIVPTPISGSKTWVGGEAEEHINANDGVDALGVTLQRKTSATDWAALTTDDAGRELVIVWGSDTGNSGYSIKAKTVADNVDPVLDTMDNSGDKYEYRIVENTVPSNYAVSYTTTSITNNTITNTSTKKDTLKVTKTWDDEDNAEGLRPDKVVMHLYKQVAGSTIQVEVAKQEIANGSETTGVTWSDLPVYDASGNKITYIVIEEAEYGYTTTYKVLSDPNATEYTAAGNSLTLDGDTAADAQTIDVKNTLVPATNTVNVTKVWNDDDNRDGKRPSSVDIPVYEYVWDKTANNNAGGYVKNNNAVATITLNGTADDSATGTGVTTQETAAWTGVVSGLPTTKNGKTVLYMAGEDTSDTNVFGAPGTEGKYSNRPVVTGGQTDGFTVTNTYTPETIDIQATKVWDDLILQMYSALGYYERPKTVTFQLKADGSAVGAPVSVSATSMVEDTEWAYQWTDLPKYKDGGQAITYTVEELAVPDGYTPVVTPASITSTTVATGTSAQVTITNTPDVADKVEADIVLHKINSATEENIGGVVFELKDSSDPAQVVGTYTTDTHGVAHINFEQLFDPAAANPAGTYTYTLTEKAPATGYQPNSDAYIITVERDGQGQVVVKDVELTNTGSKNVFEKLYSLIVGDKVNAEYDAAHRILTVKNTPTASDVTVEKRFVDENNAVIPHSIVSASGYKMHVSYTKLKDDGTGEKVTQALDLPSSATNGTYAWTLEDVVPGTDVHVHEQNYRTVAGYDFQNVTVTPTNVTADIHTDDASFTMPVTDNPVKIAFANTYTRQTGTLELLKTWSDDNNQDGKRPNSVTFRVRADYAVTGWTVDGTGSYKDFTLTKDPNALDDSDPWLPTLAENLPVFKDDGTTKILYTVSETTELPAGYTKGNSGAEYRLNAGETTSADIVNRYTPATDSLTVTKVWNDSENAAGLRPDSVRFHLYKADGTSAGVASKTIAGNATGSAASATWNGLPVYENGSKIDYMVVEEAVAGYSTSYSAAQTVQLDGVKTREATQEDVDAGNAENVGDSIAVDPQEITVTNALTAETTSVSVTKVWNDGNNVDGLRHDSVDIKLYEYVWDKTANNNAGGYVKNNNAVATITLNGTADDSATGTGVTTQETAAWTGVVSGLPAVKNGKPVMYSVDETQVNGYDVPVVTGNQVDGFTVTNTHKPATGCVEVEKVWDDNNNQDGKRVDITMTLKATIGSGDDADTVEVGSKTISANVNTPQEAIWHDLPAFRDGQRITYTVEETAITGYVTTYSDGVQLERDGDTKTLTVTNTLTPATIDIQAQKVWSDGNNQDGMRADVTLHLKGTVAGSNVTLNFDDKTIAKNAAADGVVAGTATWTGLPAYHDGKEITYTVTEEALLGYTATVTGNKTEGFTVTNSRTPAVTSVSVTKVWDDGNNVDGKRANVTVRLYKTVDGTTEEVVPFSRTLATGTNHDQNMTTTWSGLPAYEDGKPIIYTVGEDAVAGYTTQITGDAANGYTITNTHNQDTVSVTVNKTWANDNANYRPDHVVYTLKADGGSARDVNGVAVAPATALGGSYQAVFTNLPKNKFDGQGNPVAIAYTVEETALAGYTTTYADPVVDSAGNTTIAVTNTAKLGTLFVTKTWNDESNRDGKRPTADEFKSKLSIYADGKQVTLDGVATDNGDDTFTVAYTGVPVYNAASQPITYMVSESAINGYTQTGTALPTTELSATSLMGNVALANTYEPERADVSFTKQWDDVSNQDGVRPSTANFADMLELASDSGDDVSAVTPTVVDNGDNTFTITYSDLYKKWNDNGTSKDIVYTLTETLPNGSVYTADTATTTSETGANPLKNSYTPATTSVKVTKVWDDEGNQDGKRPANVTVRLLADGSEVARTQIDEGEFIFTTDGDGTTGTPLPARANGRDIVYTVTEDAVADYQQAITGDATSGYTITNSHAPGTTTVTVTKVWDDADNQDGVRPGNVTIKLLADGSEVASTTIASGSYTFTADSNGDPLPVKSGGRDIVYTVTEETVTGYNTPVITGDATAGFTVTNTHTPATTSASVTKVWGDVNNADNLRPGAVTFQLYKTVGGTTAPVPGKTITLTVSDVDANDANTWAGTIDGLPEKENGQAITYSFKEVDVPAGYSATSSANGLTITNTHERYTGCVEAFVTWNDDNNREDKRTNVTLKLLADGQPATYADGTAVADETIKNDSTQPQSVAWHNLPVNNENGEPIVYTVVETGVDSAYTITYNPPSGVTISRGGSAVIAVTNEYTPAPISVTATKVWNDGNNQDGMRADVTLHLKGTVAGSNVTLNFDDKTIAKNAAAADGVVAGTATWTGLPAYHDGKEITYTVTEEALLGYTATVTGNKTEGFTVTNSRTPAVTSVSVTKVWDDGNNVDGKRANVTVHLDKTVNGMFTDDAQPAKTLATGTNHDEDRTATWDNLPAYEDGKHVFYTVREDPIDGYTTQITGDVANGFTITNTHAPETTSVRATKVWNDSELMKADGTPIEGYDRPKTVSFQLKADGTAVGAPVAVSKSSKVGNTEWAHQWTDLPKYKSGGTEIAYTIEELEVPYGYTSAVTGNAADGFTVTNTPNVSEVLGADFVVKKVDKATGKPIAGVTFTLTSEIAGFTPVTQTTNDGGVAAFTFTKDGEYTLTETVPAGYENPDPASYTITVSKEDSASTHVELEPSGRNVFQKIYDLLFAGGGANYDATSKTLTVENTPKTNDVTVRKQFVDADTHTHIPSASIPEDFVIQANYTTLENEVAVEKTATLKVSDATYSNGTYMWSLEDVVYGTGVHVHEMKYVNVTGYDFTSTEVTAPDGAKTHDDDASFTMSDTDATVTFVNTYTKQTGNMELVKNWTDDSNRDRARPQNVSFTVTASAPVFGTASEPSTTTVVTLTGGATDTTWRDTSLTGLPLYHNGTPVTYSVDEAAVADYTKAIDQATGVTLTKGATKTLSITNTYTPKTDSLTVAKVWNDSDNAAGLRPDSVTFHLYKADGTSAGVDAKTVSDNGSATWTDLPVYGENGTKITYKVVEEAVPGYTTSYSAAQTIQLDGVKTREATQEDVDAGNAENVGDPIAVDPQAITVTNSLAPETTEVTVTKVWDDGNNADNTRVPATVALYERVWNKTSGQYGAATAVDGKTDTLSTANDATVTFSGLPATKNGEPVMYSVVETQVSGYAVPVVTGNQVDGYTVTNTLMMQEELTSQSITIVKKDEKTGVPLKGAEFTLTDPYGTEFEETTGEDGIVSFTLDAVGAWTLVETGVPENYKLGDVYSWTITTKTSEDGVTVEKVTEGEDTFWKKIKGLFFDLTPDGFVAATNTLMVDNPPIGEKTITYVDPENEDESKREVLEATIKVGDNEPAQPADPTRDGYEFGGWLRTQDSETGDVTYTANWIKIPEPGEKVIHYVDPSKPEGEQTVLREVITRGDNEPAQPADPTRDGYRFTGWKRTFDSETGDVTYTATWEEIPPAERVTVTYDPANGEDATTVPINRNENEPVQPADPTRNGFTFVGWQRVEDENGNVTYTAKWKEIPEAERITIIYDFDNGQDKVERTIERGENEPAQPADPTRKGYVFGGWLREVDKDGNVTYKAHWVEKPATSTITITRDPGNGEPPTVVEIDRNADEPAQPGDPMRDGYEFSGWDRTVDPATGNVIYKARWKKLEGLTDAVTVSYDPANGEAASTTTIERGSNEPGQPENPTREGYIFGGWLRTQDSETGNVTYTANWIEDKTCPECPSPSPCPSDDPSDDPSVDPSDDPSPQTIWVTYVDPDGTVYVKKTTIAKGAEEPPAPADPTRGQYVFDGWDRTEDEDGNITYTAKWKKMDTPTPSDTPNVTPNRTPSVSERPLTTTPLSNTGGTVGSTGMTGVMLVILGGGLLALRRQRALSTQ